MVIVRFLNTKEPPPTDNPMAVIKRTWKIFFTAYISSMRYLLIVLLFVATRTHAQLPPVCITIDSATMCSTYSHLILLQGTYTNNTTDTLFLPREKTEIAAFAYATSRDMDRTHSKDNVIIIDSTRNRMISTYNYIDYGKPFTAPDLLKCTDGIQLANKKLQVRKIGGHPCFVLPPKATIHLHTSMKMLPEDDIAFKNFTEDDRTAAHIALKYHLVYYRNGISLTEADVIATMPQNLPGEVRKLLYWR